MIRVIYQNDTLDMVDPSILGDLIASSRIKKFFRTDGWATVATDPVRGRGGAYKGPERRKRLVADFAEWKRTTL